MVPEEVDNEYDKEYLSDIERPFLIRSKSSLEFQRKEDIKELLKCFDVLKFKGRFEINEEWGVLARMSSKNSDRIKVAFKGRLEITPVEWLNEKNIQ